MVHLTRKRTSITCLGGMYVAFVYDSHPICILREGLGRWGSHMERQRGQAQTIHMDQKTGILMFPERVLCYI